MILVTYVNCFVGLVTLSRGGREHTHSTSPGQRPHEAPGATAVFLPLATRSQLQSKEYTEQSSKRWFFFQLPTRWIAGAAKAEGFWGRRLEGLVGRQPMCGQMRRSLYFGSICAVSRQTRGAGMRGAGSRASGRGRRKRSPAQRHRLTPPHPLWHETRAAALGSQNGARTPAPPLLQVPIPGASPLTGCLLGLGSRGAQGGPGRRPAGTRSRPRTRGGGGREARLPGSGAPASPSPPSPPPPRPRRGASAGCPAPARSLPPSC